MKRLIRCSAVILLWAIVLPVGCATSPRPFQYESNRELKKGPGLFSGPDGMFELYRSAPGTEMKAAASVPPPLPDRPVEEAEEGSDPTSSIQQ